MTVLTKDIIHQIIQAVKTAKLFGIESFILEPNIIRGIDETRSVAIFDNNITFDINYSIGINRLDILVNRLTVFNSIENFSVDCIIDEKINEARSLVIKADRVKVEYKCARIKAIQAPKTIEDTRKYKLEISEDIANLFIKADSAMRAETMNISCNDDVVTYEFVDSNNDVFQYESTLKAVNLVNDNFVNFRHKYSVKLIMLAIKHNNTGNFYITNKGMFNADVNGINVYIISKQ
jgi:hypothetical protein